MILMAIAAALQMNSSDIINDNLATAARLLKQAADQNAQLVVLPENFALMRKDREQPLANKEYFGAGKIQDFLKEQADQHKMWIIGGTIPLASEDSDKIYAASLVFNDKGNCVARYDKMHLFDVNLGGNEEYQESYLIEYGKAPMVIDTPIGRVGLAVCYDVRFPELFRHMQKEGAEIFTLPTAFTVPTGIAHWEVLTRSRAIENLCYFIASCQTGTHSNGRATYGHSEIIDPWGRILSTLAESEGVITAEINLKYLYELREKMPVFKHRRL
jgi:deaminated glutathione amidase